MAAADLFDLTDKVAVITGGAGGIGVVYAEALAEAGASVVVADVNIDAATTTAESLVAKGHDVIGVERRRPFRRESTSSHGPGRGRRLRRRRRPGQRRRDHRRPPALGLADIPVDEFDHVIDVNFRRPLLCAQAIIPALQAPGGGRVVNGLSPGAFMPGGIYGVSSSPSTASPSTWRPSSAGAASTSTPSPPGWSTTRAATWRSPRTRRSATRSPPPSPASLGPTGGPRRHAAAALLQGRRLDHRPDDPRGWRLDHEALTGRSATASASMTGASTSAWRRSGRRSS